ncbi:MAG: prealbumin-like fold domain-containing protein [Clostridia bacterium]|nr:prealbumin-like fold domain-containing protein [Clostridia bacterium]
MQKISDWQTIFSEEPHSISFDYEDEDKSFVWIAQVTPTPGLQQYRVIDTLPEGVELIGVKVIPTPLTAYNYGMNDYPYNLLTIAADGTISGEIEQLWLSKTIASGSLSTDADGRQVVDVTLTANSSSSDLFNNTFYVIYYCQLSEEAWPRNGTVHLTLDNTVRVETNGDDYGEAENEILIDATKMEKIVGKAGSWDANSHMISYTVDINPSAENLLTDSDGLVDPEWLQFTDVLTYTARQGTGTGEVVLSLNSVMLEKEENGVWTELSTVQWTAHTETDPANPDAKQAYIEMRIPDSTHLRLTYSYHVNSSMANGITLTNSATLEGHGDQSGEENTHLEAEDFDTSGESTFEEFCLIKIDQEDGSPLAGAVFTVYTWDAVNREWVATPKTYTTDAVGKIIIKVIDKYDDDTRVYQKDTAYCIMETTAPPGYILPENPRPFYFWFSEYESVPHTGPDDFMLTAADISTSSQRIEAENQCIHEDVPITGVFGTKLIPSFIATLAALSGTGFMTWRVIKKKKRYGTA